MQTMLLLYMIRFSRCNAALRTYFFTFSTANTAAGNHISLFRKRSCSECIAFSENGVYAKMPPRNSFLRGFPLCNFHFTYCLLLWEVRTFLLGSYFFVSFAEFFYWITLQHIKRNYHSKSFFRSLCTSMVIYKNVVKCCCFIKRNTL